MSLTVDVPQDLEKELSAEAAQLGISLPEYILRILSTVLPAARRPKTGAELVDYWRDEGLVGSRSDITDSQAQSHRIRERADRRLSE
jgi:hypothetical protein